MSKNIKIALADDEVLIRQGIKNILKSETNIDVLFDVSNGNELIEQLNLSNQHPDIILMDINMPIINGVEATKYIYNKYPEIAIVALTSYTTDIFIKKMLAVGAVGFIPKTVNPNDLIYRINFVYENGFYYDESMMKFIKDIKEETDTVSKTVLSERELEILKFICQQKSSVEISQLLNISNRTVDGHRNHLLLKTESKSIAGLVIFAIQNNYFIPGVEN